MRQLLAIFLFILFFSCKEKSNEQSEMEISHLNKKMMHLAQFIDNADSSKKALSVLNQITSIDSNNFLGHYNKLMFYHKLQQYDSSIVTIKKLIRLRPNAHDLYLSAGFIYEKIGDSLSAQSYLQKSLNICENVLDTMSNKNKDYRMLLNNKGIALVLINDSLKAQEKLRAIYNDRNNAEFKEDILLLMNKSKGEIIRQFSGERE